MGKLVGTFPTRGELDLFRAATGPLSLPYEVISPDPGYAAVGVPAVVMDESVRRSMAAQGVEGLGCSGWVPYRPASAPVPSQPPPEFREDVWGRAAVMVLGSCIGDLTRIRLIAQLSGNLAGAMPFLNAEMPGGAYNPDGPTFTFMEGHRMVTLYPRRVFLAKADEIVDAWRLLERARRLVNEVWARRGRIVPCHERRSRPPALEIYGRLPQTNCGQCGEMTCMAFALRLWAGEAGPAECRPLWDGEYRHLRPALEGICAGAAATAPAGSRPLGDGTAGLREVGGR